MKNTFLILISLIFLNSYSQENLKAFSIIDAGVELQVYPTGFLPGFRVETNLSNKDVVNFRIGLNIFDHKDFPKQAKINDHTSEIGMGYGFSVGYKRYLLDNNKKLYAGIRTDIWFNKVDWQATRIGLPTSGTTNIIVVQPTFELGWLFEFGENKNIFFSPEIGLGYEYNAKVSGEQTGYGLILLGGINAGYRFNKK